MVTTRPYYKQYSSLRFDVVRSPQQQSILGQVRNSKHIKPLILNRPTPLGPNPKYSNKFTIYLVNIHAELIDHLRKIQANNSDVVRKIGYAELQ